MRIPMIVLAALALPLLGAPKDAGFVDSFTGPQLAHRRLMRTAHPDQGGSAWLASGLNAARDLLLGA